MRVAVFLFFMSLGKFAPSVMPSTLSGHLLILAEHPLILAEHPFLHAELPLKLFARCSSDTAMMSAVAQS